jgi:hypothetical protein
MAIEDDVASLESDVSTLQNEVATLQSEVSALQEAPIENQCMYPSCTNNGTIQINYPEIGYSEYICSTHVGLITKKYKRDRQRTLLGR